MTRVGAVTDKEDLRGLVASFLYDSLCGRELIVVDDSAAAPLSAARAKAPVAPRVPSALDASKLCSMLGRSAPLLAQNNLIVQCFLAWIPG